MLSVFITGIPPSSLYCAQISEAAWKFLSDIGFKRYINPEVPAEIRRAARCAYYGGRIEVPVYGCIDGPL